MSHDLRHAVRMLLKRPSFSIISVLTLAIAIGANTAMFSVVHGVLLKPLPYPAPERIVQLWERTDVGSRVAVSSPNFLDWRTRSRSFDAVAAYAGGRETVLGGAEPVFASVYAVTGGFFRVFGVQPAIGRTFVSEESRLGGVPAVVVGQGFWERVLGGNRALDRLSLRLAGVSCRVVGVMPRGFAHPADAEVWFPAELIPDTSGRTGHNLDVVARVRDSIDLPRARVEMTALAATLQREHPGDNDALDVTIVTLRDALTGTSRDALLMLFAAVGLVLLIACANVASMLLAQGEERRTELTIRAALGARRMRLVRQLLVENLLLSALSAAGGLLIAAWLVRALLASSGEAVPRVEAVGINAVVLLFTMALAAATPLLVGLMPSLQVSRAELRAALADAGRQPASPIRSRARNVLVAGEVALAILLMAGAALLIRSFRHVLAVDAGFEIRGAITAELALPPEKYPEAGAAAAFYTELLPRVRSIPGVRAAGAITQLPLAAGNAGGGFQFEGLDETRYAGYRVVTDGYFEAMRIPLLSGRTIAAVDTAGTDPVAVVNQAFAQQYLGGRDPIGVLFRYHGMDRVNPTFTIVGVVGDVRHRALVRGVEPQVYVAYRQQPFRTRYMTMVVRTDREGLDAAIVPAVRARVRGVDPDVPLRFSTLDEVVGASIADRRFTMALLTSFAAVALLLAAVGIYGVLAFLVAQRRHEIGIRMALGAEARSVVALLMRTGMGAVLVGIGLGLAGAVAATRLLRRFLFGVEPLDPAALGAAVALLFLVACLAAYLPARRAARLDPLAALRLP
jgi:predicted permease